MSSSTPDWGTLRKRLDNIKLPVAAFTICEDPDLRQDLARAKANHQKATDRLAAGDDTESDVKAFLQKTVDTAKADLAAAQKAFDKASVTLRFTALERKALEALQKEHPPAEADEANGEDFAMETFAPALISAASLDGMPLEDAQHFLNTWSTADATSLWRAAWGIQHQQRTDLGKG
ncbi:hypothetical protein [Streptomyces sp. NBRC 110035]|uniref:hypothetical protein n=1 Tax=Streptomyces sp. NBRC 110035 TaxID=1547867 RepID=UPI0005A67A52|nr:hypothetical protein [Streptomyces sp. NBRC 110035]